VRAPRGGARDRGPAAGRHLVVRVDQVDPVVRDLAAQGRRGLGRPDVHAPVDLHRVRAEDLAADAPCDLAGDLGLAGARETDQGQHARPQHRC
jgi:hypothetical protein